MIYTTFHIYIQTPSRQEFFTRYSKKMTTNTLVSMYKTLPFDVIVHILQYDKRFVLRNQKIMSRINDNDYRYNILDAVCLEFVYNPTRSVNNIIIELPITRDKSYVIEMSYVRYIYVDETEEEDIVQMLSFHQPFRDRELLCEY